MNDNDESEHGYEHLMAVSNATTLLIQAARISPPLIEAARLVDQEIHALRDEIDRLRAALVLISKEPAPGSTTYCRNTAKAALSGGRGRCQAVAPFRGFHVEVLRCVLPDGHEHEWHENGPNGWTGENGGER
jgi:hypothetical protein